MQKIEGGLLSVAARLGFSGLVTRYKDAQEYRRQAEFFAHKEPTNANFFWMMGYIKRHAINLTAQDQGYSMRAQINIGKWSNDTVINLGINQPTKSPHLVVTSKLRWSLHPDLKDHIEMQTFVKDTTVKHAAGDSRVDTLHKPSKKNPINGLQISEWHSTGSNAFGIPEGIFEISQENIVKTTQSAYRVAWEFLLNGRLPPSEVAMLNG